MQAAIAASADGASSSSGAAGIRGMVQGMIEEARRLPPVPPMPVDYSGLLASLRRWVEELQGTAADVEQAQAVRAERCACCSAAGAALIMHGRSLTMGQRGGPAACCVQPHCRQPHACRPIHFVLSNLPCRRRAGSALMWPLSWPQQHSLATLLAGIGSLGWARSCRWWPAASQRWQARRPLARRRRRRCSSWPSG